MVFGRGLKQALEADVLAPGAILRTSAWLIHPTGDAGAKALSKVTSLLLAAIAVMLICRGLESFRAPMGNVARIGAH
jgi:small neutral amino acid transporter SnatA (MarC family)